MKKIELENKLKKAVSNKNITELMTVAQEIFDAGLELEEMKVSKLTLLTAMENLAKSGWIPSLKDH